MGTLKRTACLAALAIALAGPAVADPPELDDAIDAYLDKDYSQLSVIQTYADQGKADALATVGQAYFYGLGYERNRPLGMEYFQKAADAGDWPAAVQLGRIYQYGSSGQTKDMEKAVELFVLAAALGDPAGATRLQQLPRDLVIAAGGEPYMPAPEPDQQPAPQLSPEPQAQPSPGTDFQSVSRLNAISTYVSDGTNADIVLANARKGDADSARVLGHHCLRNTKCPSTRKEAHDLLAASAQTDGSCATTLAAIYRDGAWGGQPYPVDAAKWYVHAYKLGETNAKYQLDRMPDEVVREAGGTAIVTELRAADARVRQSAQQPAPTPSPPAPQPQTPAPSSPAERGAEMSDQALADTLIDAIFGPSGPATPVELQDGTRMPVFARTQFSPAADAAGSCLLVLSPAVEAKNRQVEALADKLEREMKGTPSVETWGDLAVAETQLSTMMIWLETAHEIVNDPARNGGFDESGVEWQLVKHSAAQSKAPSSGPSAQLCEDKMHLIMIRASTDSQP